MTIKRIMDLTLTAPVLVLISPILAFISIWIKLDSPGSVLFKQIRVGRYGKNFALYKFRTMVENAEASGGKITAAGDARITHSGRFLRKYKFDELPQLFNVLMGEMSLVGPRPEVPEYVAYWPERDKQIILSVLPGITDYATIEFRDEEGVLRDADDVHETYISKVLPIKIELYKKYVRENSVILDLKLIFLTLKKIILSG